MKKRILLIILVVLIILIAGISGVYIYFSSSKSDSKQDSEDNFTNIGSAEINKDRDFMGLKFTDGSLSSDGKLVRYTVTITNNKDEDIELGKWIIIFKDKKGNEINRLVGYIQESIGAGESITPTIEAEIDLSNAYTLEYAEYEEINLDEVVSSMSEEDLKTYEDENGAKNNDGESDK